LQNPSKFVKCKNSDQTTVPSQVAASQCYHLCRSTSDVIRVSAGDMNRSARNKHFSLLSLTVDWRSFSPESTVCLVGEVVLTGIYRLFGWRVAGAGAERSGSAPAAVWTRSGGSGAAPEGIYPLDVGRLPPLKFGGRSGFAPGFLTVSLRLTPVTPTSLLSLVRRRPWRPGSAEPAAEARPQFFWWCDLAYLFSDEGSHFAKQTFDICWSQSSQESPWATSRAGFFTSQ
jgi:hypothetical protein